jgi:lipase chaperone LimK
LLCNTGNNNQQRSTTTNNAQQQSTTINMKIKKSRFWFGAAALAAAFIVAFAVRPDSPEDVAPKVVASSPNPFPFVRSMDGTKPDGDIKTNPEDKLIVDAELGRMFDYYLSALGEKSLSAIQVEAERELSSRLKPAAAAEAKRLLTNYLNYKRALVEAEKNPQIAGGTAAAVRGRLKAMQKVREKFFTAKESEGLFGFNDTYDTDAVARIEIAEDKTLTEDQKKEKLAAVDAAMSPKLREEHDAPLRLVKLEEEAEKIRAKGGTEQDVYQMRAKTISPEAASRLAIVDQEEAAWKARITTYLAQRAAILSSNRSEAERAAAIQQLRQANFNENDQGRLPAYE